MPKKLFKKIIIPIIILGFFLAPVSPIFKNDNGKLAAGIGVNKVEAQTDIASIDIKVNQTETTGTAITFDVSISDPTQKYEKITVSVYDQKIIIPTVEGQTIWDANPNIDIKNVYGPAESKKETTDVTFELKDIKTSSSELTPGKTYTIFVSLFYYGNEIKPDAPLIIEGLDVTTPSSDSAEAVVGTSTGGEISATGFEFSCSVVPMRLQACIAALSYYIWEVTSFLAGLTGRLLDFFVYYSTNSSAYSSVFIEKGWGIIRDIANIFFIIALLYIAIKTILSLNVTNNKKLIGTIVLIALVINFSLFITKVVIDGSNILAKVFYNQITTENEDTTVADTGAGGEKSVSTNIVKGFNPQTIVDQALYDNNTGPNKGPDRFANNAGSFILITIILIFLTLYAAYMFAVVSILFIGRVVALWICMIFSPLAFISYAVPFDIPGFGHKKWWKDLLESAFLAPIFIFFLYIIVLFIDLGKKAVEITYGSSDAVSSSDFMLTIMSVIIPFAIIFLMLTRAKKLAVDMSGELGAMITKVGGTIMKVGGGAVLGAAAVAGGGALRATVGRAGSAVAGSAWAKDTRFGRAVGGLAGKVGKGSFDIRGAKIAGMGLAGVTGLKLGEAKKGGFEQAKADQIAKRQQRAQELEAGHGEKERKDLNTAESEHQGILGKLAVEIEKLDKTIDKTRQAELDAKNRVITLTKTGDIGEEKKDKDGKVIQTQGKDYAVYQKAKEDQRRASDNLTALKAQKTALRKGEDYHEKIKDENGDPKDIGGDYSKTAVHTNKDGTTRSIKSYEDDLIPEAKGALKALNAQRKFGYAKGMDKWGSKIFNYITSAGMHSGIGANEAAYKIRMDMKLDSGTKTS